MNDAIYDKLTSWIANLPIENIDVNRMDMLTEIGKNLREHLAVKKQFNLHFLCTHNSRRSQMAQALGQLMASFFDLPISCFSGGTEVTAFHPNAIQCLRAIGFQIYEKENIGNQSTFQVNFSDQENGAIMWSKLIDDPRNPKEDFIAMFTCDQAAEACPIVFGSLQNIKLNYQDPKIYDSLKNAHKAYVKCAIKIASELKIVFASVLN